MSEYVDMLEYRATATRDERLEEVENLLVELEDEMRGIEELKHLPFDLKEEIMWEYTGQIKECEGRITYFERAGL